jgi:hypothetical protein
MTFGGRVSSGLAFCLMLATPLAARCQAVNPAAPLAYFSGAWKCAGHYAGGAVIASNLVFYWSAPAAAMITHHDDVAPGAYHAVELWNAESAGGMHGLIVDSLGGARPIVALGWEGDVLTWVYLNATRTERFVYAKLGPDRMRADWLVSKDQGPFQLGDTLTCDRAPVKATN